MTFKKNELKTDTAPIAQNDPKGVRIDGYWGPGLARPGAGKLVQRSGEAQFCGSIAFRLFGYEEGAKKIRGKVLLDEDGQPRMGRRYSGDFMCVTWEGKRMFASDGYLPSALDRSAKARIDRGETVSFAGDLWCEPAENTPLGYTFTVYDRRDRDDDPLMQLAVDAGLIPPPLPRQRAIADNREEEDVDPETGEVIEREQQRDAAE